MDAIGDCKDKAPPDSFEPEGQWSWGSAQVEGGSTATPLVANLTDDNGDGAIDLCDIPDVVVVAGGGGVAGGIPPTQRITTHQDHIRRDGDLDFDLHLPFSPCVVV